jgi:predicted MFS family arabinose efflux permease
MSDEAIEGEKPSTGKWFIPSLVVSFLAVGVSTPILMLLTLDIAETFQVPFGVAAQLSTINSIAEVILSLLMGFLAIRFKHKSLLLSGVALVAASAVGAFFAPTLELMLFFFALEGAGTVMVGVMGLTLIGDLLPLSKKAKAVSYVIATTYLTAIVGVAAIGFIANVAGWRSVFSLFVLPVSIAGLALAFLSLPYRSREESVAIGRKAYLSAFKQVLLNRSAVACLVGSMLMSVMSLALFTTGFFREQLSASRDVAAVIIMMAASMYVVAALVTGRLINIFGRKTLTVTGVLGSSILAMLIFFMPNLWLAVIVDMIHVWFAAVGITAFSCYALEQVPKSRSTMMSLRSIFNEMGGAIGAALGGALLILFAYNLSLSYQTVGIAFGAIGISASAVFYFLTKDPTKPKIAVH